VGLGFDEIFVRTDSTARYFLRDALGSTLALTDGSATVRTEYTYEAYGESTNSGDALSNAFQYTGRENDSAEPYYYRARYYQPGIKRFMSEDPIGLEGGVNTYGYVAGDPVSFADPLGLDRRGGEGGVGIVYTNMTEGWTMFYDSWTGESFKFPSRNAVASGSLPGAGDPHSALVTYCETGKLPISFGAAKMRTTDSRHRFLHGGGRGLEEPWAPRQGWKPTEGMHSRTK
jgi:RHS repeat-associated protein